MPNIAVSMTSPKRFAHQRGARWSNSVAGRSATSSVRRGMAFSGVIALLLAAGLVIVDWIVRLGCVGWTVFEAVAPEPTEQHDEAAEHPERDRPWCEHKADEGRAGHKCKQDRKYRRADDGVAVFRRRVVYRGAKHLPYVRVEPGDDRRIRRTFPNCVPPLNY